MKGHVGKILKVDLTSRTTDTIPTSDYEGWYGGHGMGSAIAFDLIDDWSIDGFNPKNVITVMTSPTSGTLVPSASGRTEVQGIGVQSSPIGWYTRSNFGGRFSGQLKYAGWDGIVIQGAADSPVWLDIRNGHVSIKVATELWGLDTWETQEEIWREVTGGSSFKNWREVGAGRNAGRTIQRPAVLAIGPAGENLCRTACLMHDAGAGAGQGGFGAVWGAKKLKAISVIGTGSVEIADPNALMEARVWSRQYAMDMDNVTKSRWAFLSFGDSLRSGAMLSTGPQTPKLGRPSGCLGCNTSCRARYEGGRGNESTCVESVFYSAYDVAAHGGPTVAQYMASDLLNKYGINAYEANKMLPWLIGLHEMGLIGPGKPMSSSLPFDKVGELEFVEAYLKAMAYREGEGDDFAEGGYRCAERWGRLEEDLGTGLLDYSYWGLPNHGYDPRAELEWGYGSILGERDINEHGFNPLFWSPFYDMAAGDEPWYSAEQVANIYAEKMVPYQGDPLMVDYGNDNMYSQHWAKTVAWHRHYTRFWKQSISYCDWRWPNFFNPYRPDDRGMTVEGEPKFLNAVTGGNLTFEEGMELGRKIWNLDNAIWTLQGRDREMVHFSPYIYSQPFQGMVGPMYPLPGRENGEWTYISAIGRFLDKDQFDSWKTLFYELEGWDTDNGWPTRSTLDGLDLGSVADKLQAAGRLGA